MMDIQELGAMLHMQKQTQLLLQKLHSQQSHCHELLSNSLSSLSSSSLEISSTDIAPIQQNSHNTKTVKRPPPTTHQTHQDQSLHQRQSLHQGLAQSGVQAHRSENVSHLSRSVLASKAQKQEILNHLEGKTKLKSYHKVSATDKPGRKPEGRLVQGIENNKFQFGDASTQSNGHREATLPKEKWNGYEYSLESDRTEPDCEDRINTSVTFQDELELLGLSDSCKTNTPKRPTRSLADTPRSILKHRKIIDDNVHVQSEFTHTPVSLVTPRGKYGLNYSYSDAGDVAMETSELSGNHDNDHCYSNATDGSYIEEYLDENGSPSTHSPQNHNPSKPTSESNPAELSALEELIKDRLLLHSGNDRKNASIVNDLSNRPKSYVFASTDGSGEPEVSHEVPAKQRTPIKVQTHL